MEILDCSGTTQVGKAFPVEQYYADGRAEELEGTVLGEQKVSVLVNGKPRTRLHCTPDKIAQAVMGRLFCEGELNHVKQALMANIGTAGRVVYVQVSQAAVAQGGCRGIAEQLSKALEDGAEDAYSTLVPKEWDPDCLMALAQAFEEGLEGPARLRGIHSVAIGAGDDILYQCWDRNVEAAYDKAIGSAFIDGVDLSECTLVTNAPLGVEAFSRFVHAHITTVVALGCPTEEDVALARMTKITLADAPEEGTLRILNGA